MTPSAWTADVPAEQRTELDERTTLLLADALLALESVPEASITAVVTDPPYSPLEFSDTHHRKLREGRGGVWRIPPSFDGVKRRPLPRFTVLTDADYEQMEAFFERLARALHRVLVPGGHVVLASNPIVCDFAFYPLRRAGFEKRGVVSRQVRTFRGGDRPKGAHEEFAYLSVMPRSSHEPWGLFRKPLDGTVAHNLRRWRAGALRRPEVDRPFSDVILCAPARGAERKLSDHPSLKPQRFLRQVVAAVLPLGEGVVLDPFAGSGSTLAAASHLGFRSVGIERDALYFQRVEASFPALRDLEVKR